MTKYEVAEIAAINGLDDNEWRKISAARQRELFGFVIAGKKDIRFNPIDQGTVIVGRTVTGKDFISRDYSYEEFAACVSGHKTVEAE